MAGRPTEKRLGEDLLDMRLLRINSGSYERHYQVTVLWESRKINGPNTDAMIMGLL